jgi:hypothetical protein
MQTKRHLEGGSIMKNTVKKQSTMGIFMSNPSTDALRGRQSVRTTFRLSEACINAISILATQLGIKQKSVFDHLLEDDQVLKNVAAELGDAEFDRNQCVQKTFVISRRSLSFLDTIASKHKAPRDALVEYSVRRLLPIIARERKKHELRKDLLTEISDNVSKSEKLLSKAIKMLGAQDPIVSKLETATSAYQNAFDEIVNFIKKGKIIEEFRIE